MSTAELYNSLLPVCILSLDAPEYSLRIVTQSFGLSKDRTQAFILLETTADTLGMQVGSCT